MYALILSGGMGERLRPLTNEIPKPMAPVNGKPILWHQIQWLKLAGVTDVIFLAGYRWETIKEYFGDGRDFEINTHFSIEDSPLGRGGAIRKGLDMVPRDQSLVFVLNGDTITSENPNTLLVDFKRRITENYSHMATIMLVPMISPYGLVDIDSDNRVTGFREKVEIPYWINAGIYIFNRNIINVLPSLGDHETETFPDLSKSNQISAILSREYWRGIDSLKDLREAEDFVTSNM